MDALNALVRGIGLTVASVGAVNTSINLRPDAGFIYKILGCWGYHTAGANRNTAWYWTDPETPAGVNLSGTISLATSTPLALGAMAASAQPLSSHALWATNQSYPTFLFTAGGAAENGFVLALVLKYSAQGKV